MFKSMLNKESIWMMGSQLCFGVLGALMVQFFMPFHSSSNIATVNITALQDSFIKETAHQQISQTEMKQRVNLFATNLTQALSKIARQNNLVIVPSEAVMAGKHLDLTEVVSKEVKRGLSQ